MIFSNFCSLGMIFLYLFVHMETGILLHKNNYTNKIKQIKYLFIVK